MFSHLSDVQETSNGSNYSILDIIEDKDDFNRTALHLACRWGRDEAVNFLLDHNASISSKDCSGDTPLHLALRFGHVECVKNMLTHYPDILLPNYLGKTPVDELPLNESDKHPNSAYLYLLLNKYLREDYFLYMKDVLDFESTSEISRLHSLPESIIDVIVTFISGVGEESTNEASVKHLRREIESTRDKRKKDGLGVDETDILW